MTEQESTIGQQATVDETPISPSRPDAARKNSLENHLLHRPERHELVESMYRTGWHLDTQQCQADMCEYGLGGLQTDGRVLDRKHSSGFQCCARSSGPTEGGKR